MRFSGTAQWGLPCYFLFNICCNMFSGFTLKQPLHDSFYGLDSHIQCSSFLKLAAYISRLLAIHTYNLFDSLSILVCYMHIIYRYYNME